MLRKTYLFENRTFTNKVNTASFRAGKKNNIVLIKIVKYT